MDSRFLNRILFSQALAEQERIFAEVRTEKSAGVVFGFESEPVVTLGLRGSANDDVVELRPEFSLVQLNRGGQATLHNPGQLVVFPIFSVREWGAKRWVEGLAEVTRLTVSNLGVESWWDPDCPGLYTERGKIMACGVRIVDGISTHGIALNVHNDLSAFQQIRACGISRAKMDKIEGVATLAEVFAVWVRNFRAHFLGES